MERFLGGVDAAVEPVGRVGAHRQESDVIDHHQICEEEPATTLVTCHRSGGRA